MSKKFSVRSDFGTKLTHFVAETPSNFVEKLTLVRLNALRKHVIL